MRFVEEINGDILYLLLVYHPKVKFIIHIIFTEHPGTLTGRHGCLIQTDSGSTRHSTTPAPSFSDRTTLKLSGPRCSHRPISGDFIGWAKAGGCKSFSHLQGSVSGGVVQGSWVLTGGKMSDTTIFWPDCALAKRASALV